jgi:hypothetical protein
MLQEPGQEQAPGLPPPLLERTDLPERHVRRPPFIKLHPQSVPMCVAQQLNPPSHIVVLTGPIALPCIIAPLFITTGAPALLHQWWWLARFMQPCWHSIIVLWFAHTAPSWGVNISGLCTVLNYHAPVTTRQLTPC